MKMRGLCPLGIAGVALLSGISLCSNVVKAPPQPSDRPFVKLFAVVRGGRLPDTGDQTLRLLANTFGWINSHGGPWRYPDQPTDIFFGRSGGLDAQGFTVEQRLRAINPNIILSNYRNSMYTHQYGMEEATEVEHLLPLSIAVHNTGASLSQPVTATEEMIVVRPPANVPAGKNAAYPFKASTTDLSHSSDRSRYAAWLRLDDEILRIKAVETLPDGAIRLVVNRGEWGTRAVGHSASSIVLQPIYYGSISRDGSQNYLSGFPDSRGQQRSLTYLLMMQRPQVWEFVGDKVARLVDDGLQDIWLDCSVSTWNGPTNAYGDAIQAPYDVDKKRDCDRESYREYQQQKLDYLFHRFAGTRFYVNWFFPQFYFENGTEKLLFSGANGHHPIFGGAIEMYANDRNMDWKQLMHMQLDMIANRYTVTSWIKYSGRGDDSDMPREYKLFGYGTYLLVFEPGASQYWGGAWKAEGRQQFAPPDFVYWDLGKPLESFSEIARAEVPGSPGMYRRQYTKGLVLVNPDGKNARTAKLDQEYYEPESNAFVSSVTLQPRTARLMLKSQ